MQNAPAETAKQKFFTKERLSNWGRNTASVLKAGAGALSLAIGVSFISSGLLFGIALGGMAAYTGGRTLFEAGKELLPLKVQSKISEVFTGKKLTEITPVKQPTTPLGIAFRFTEYVAMALTGAAALAAGSFAIGMGSQARSAAALALGGLALMTAGGAAVLAKTAKGILHAVREIRGDRTAPVFGPVPSSPAPDLSPAPKLDDNAGAGFNKAALPEAAATQAPQPKPQPAPDAPKP